MGGFQEPLLHVDMDAFFVEVERLHAPDLVGVPVIVGGLGSRGVVASASYEARAHGVRSAMPMTEARRRSPTARLVAPHHERYGDVSHQVFEILRSFTPLVESLSVDEGFLDVSGLRLHYPSSIAVAEAIRETIRSALGLPASVGIAATKFIAKMASDEAKPDGVFCVTAGEERAYLDPLPVGRLWGVGQATRATFEGLGVHTIGDLARLDPKVVTAHLGAGSGRHLLELAHGRDPRQVSTKRSVKSVSVETTFPTDLFARAEIDRELLRLCDKLSVRLDGQESPGRTVSLKVRTGDFVTLTRSSTESGPVHGTSHLLRIVRDLYTKVPPGHRGVRLLGIGVSGFAEPESHEQLSFAAEEPVESSGAAAVVRDVRQRFGDDALMPARLVEPEDLTRE